MMLKVLIYAYSRGIYSSRRKEQIIVTVDVTQSATNHHQLEPMVEQAEQNLEQLPEQISADAGYSACARKVLMIISSMWKRKK